MPQARMTLVTTGVTEQPHRGSNCCSQASRRDSMRSWVDPKARPWPKGIRTITGLTIGVDREVDSEPFLGIDREPPFSTLGPSEGIVLSKSKGRPIGLD
jgi:hypothetical protein